MKILCVDTSSSDTLLGIGENGKTLSDIRISSSDHAVQLLSSLERLLANVGCALADMNAFCVVLGPGSFTGLRIGLSTVKGFAYALDKPVIGISALDALAQTAVLHDAPVYPVIHSRKGKVFTAGYTKKKAKMARTESSCEVDPSAFFREKTGYILLGSALEKQPDLFSNLSFDRHTSNHIDHQTLCTMAFEKFHRGDFVDIRSIEPDYVVSEVASLV